MGLGTRLYATVPGVGVGVGCGGNLKMGTAISCREGQSCDLAVSIWLVEGLIATSDVALKHRSTIKWFKWFHGSYSHYN